MLDRVSLALLAIACGCLGYLAVMRSARPTLGYNDPDLAGRLELFRWVGPVGAILFATLALSPGTVDQAESSLPFFLLALFMGLAGATLALREYLRAAGKLPTRTREWQDGDPILRRRKDRRWMG